MSELVEGPLGPEIGREGHRQNSRVGDHVPARVVAHQQRRATVGDVPEATHLAPKLRREGEVWAIEHAGAVVRLRDSKGLRHLARLLEEPEREIPALEFARATHGTTRQSTPADAALHDRRDADDHAGPLLDAQAKAAYRQRLADLHEELDEADRWHDSERAARAQVEIDAVPCCSAPLRERS